MGGTESASLLNAASCMVTRLSSVVGRSLPRAAVVNVGARAAHEAQDAYLRPAEGLRHLGANVLVALGNSAIIHDTTTARYDTFSRREATVYLRPRGGFARRVPLRGPRALPRPQPERR